MLWPHQALEKTLLIKSVTVGQAGIPGVAGVTVPHVIPHFPCTVKKRGQEQDPVCSQRMDLSQQYPGRVARRWDNLVKGNPVT